MRQILINAEPYEKRVAVIHKDLLEDFRIERSDQPRLAGNIYKSVIESVVPGIGALFADIGTGKNGFLYVQNLEEKTLQALLGEEILIEKKSSEKISREKLRKGQELIVQIVKEPMGTKGPLLTTDISLPGKYLVLMPFNDTMGVSKRIEDKNHRQMLKNTLEDFKLPKGSGCIARTQSREIGPRQLKSELKYLIHLWSQIQHRSKREKAPSILYEEYNLPLRIIRDTVDKDVDKVLVDSKEEFKKICRFANSMQPDLRKKIFYYKGRIPLFEKYGIENKIEGIFKKKVFLKSGGHIVIEPTESLVAIDVNTGKFTGRRNPEATTFKTNMEAASEIAKQVMLRDLGGIIVIDFIDMLERRHKKEVYDTLENAFKNDKAKINILTISPMGLVEMTRQRVRKSLESISLKECPYCNGAGRVKTPATISIEALRKLEGLMAQRRTREMFIVAHPDVIEYMEKSFKDVFYTLERRFHKKIVTKTDPRLHVEDVHFE